MTTKELLLNIVKETEEKEYQECLNKAHEFVEEVILPMCKEKAQKKSRELKTCLTPNSRVNNLIVKELKNKDIHNLEVSVYNGQFHISW